MTATRMRAHRPQLQVKTPLPETLNTMSTLLKHQVEMRPVRRLPNSAVELFRREILSGAMAGPSLVLKAAGPVAIAWIVNATPAASFVLGILLVASLISLACYLVSIRVQQERHRSVDLVSAPEPFSSGPSH
jgi:hypothetical protein